MIICMCEYAYWISDLFQFYHATALVMVEAMLGSSLVQAVLAMKVMHYCSSAHRHNLILYAEVLESEKNSEQGVL